MNQVNFVRETPQDTEVLSSPPLHGLCLITVRAVWSIIFVLSIGICIFGFPSHFSHYSENPDWMILKPEQVEALYNLGLSPLLREKYIIAIELLTWLIFLFIAVFLFWQRSNDWVVIAISLLLITYMSTELPFTSSLEHFSSAWRWLVNSIQAVGEILSLIVFYFFPNGRFVPRWTRFLAFAYGGLVLIWLFYPDLKFNVVYGETFNKTPISSLSVILAWHVTSLYALIFRYRNTENSVLRQQMKWVVFGLTIGFMASTLRYAIDVSVEQLYLIKDPRSQVIFDMLLHPIHWLLLTIVPLSFGVAILRYGLWSIDIIIKRTLVYGLLTASIFGIYMFIVGFLSLLFQANFNNFLISLIGTGFIAALFNPLRKRLQRTTDKFLYGDRKDPYAAIANVSSRLDAALRPEDILPSVVQTIGESLQLPYVAIHLTQNNGQNYPNNSKNFTLAAQFGTPVIRPNIQESLSLIYQNTIIGQLTIATRPGDGKLSKEDKRLLTTLAKQASITAHSVQLMLELQKARELLVFAREDERQRLRFNLHDVLGGRLAGQNLILQTALEELRGNPEYAAQLMGQSINNTKTAIADIRQVIHDLRPPAIDELGLLTAVREQAIQYQNSNLNFIFNLPENLPLLPPAIEVACYRIVQEAITNVVRHANATNCTIRLAIGNSVNLDICDDGCKKLQSYQPGVGITSMRTRAEELGGTFDIKPNFQQGTCIQVNLPFS